MFKNTKNSSINYNSAEIRTSVACIVIHYTGQHTKVTQKKKWCRDVWSITRRNNKISQNSSKYKFDDVDLRSNLYFAEDVRRLHIEMSSSLVCPAKRWRCSREYLFVEKACILLSWGYLPKWCCAYDEFNEGQALAGSFCWSSLLFVRGREISTITLFLQYLSCFFFFRFTRWLIFV